MTQSPFSLLLKVTFLLVGISFNGMSQNLHADTLLVQKFIDLSNDLMSEGNVDQIVVYCKKALIISEKRHYLKGQEKAYFTLGNAYSFDGKSALGLQMYQKALKIAKENRDYNFVADCYLNIGTVYDDMSDYSNALSYYYRSLESAKKMNRIDLFGDCYRNIGIVEYSIGDYPKSLKTLYKSLRYYEQLKARSSIADVYNCLGNVYSELGDTKTALQVYSTSLKIALELDEKESIGNAYINIGTVYSDLGNYEKAIGKYHLALQTYESISDQIGLSLVYNSLGEVYFKTGKYEDALRMSNESLKITKVSLDQAESICSYINIGNVYIHQNKLEKAREILNFALKLSKEIGSKLYVRETYESLIELEKKSNNFKAAFEDQRLWVIYKDSINNEETARQSFRTVLEYSFEKKALSAQQKNDKAVFKLKSQNRLSGQKQLFLMVILIVLVLSAIVVWFFARRSINNRKQLAEVLANENAHKEVLLQEVHHRVNNSLQMISSLLSIQADTTTNEEIREYLMKSENRVQSMSVMHQLLHLGNSKLEVNMKDYFSEVLDFYTNILESKPGVKLNSSIPSVLFHTKLAMPLALILNELITNSLKYAFPTNEGVIAISLVETEKESWLFSVKDNGIGLIEKKTSEDQSSIGLDLVKLMTKQINGELHIDSSNGLSVEIRFSGKK